MRDKMCLIRRGQGTCALLFTENGSLESNIEFLLSNKTQPYRIRDKVCVPILTLTPLL